MATSINRKQDQSNQSTGKVTAASELAERHHRTSKHRAPMRTVRPPVRRPQPPAEEKPKPKDSSGKKPSRLRNLLAVDTFSSRLIIVGWVALLVIVVVLLSIFAFQFAAASRFFSVRTVSLEGNTILTQEQVEALVRDVARRGTLRADLNQIRDKLLTNEVIKDAWVVRVLPDTLKVIVKEREPYTHVRRIDHSVGCVDLEGMIFNCQPGQPLKVNLPPIKGLAEVGPQAAEINLRRISDYQKLIEDLDRPQDRLSSRIDEVDFKDTDDISVILKDSDVAVLLGKEDFRTRLNAALDVLEAVKRNDAEQLNVLRISDAERLLSGARISYLNATIPKRIIVGLSE